jgi:hypothetical protein
MEGVILVADITRKDTLQSLKTYWIPKVNNIVGNVPLVILANKSDLMKHAEIEEKDIRIFASKYGAPFYLTSAKNGENVNDAFNTLGKHILEFKGAKTPTPTEPRANHPQFLDDDIAGEGPMIIDRLIDDFCREFGKVEAAMPIIRKQFELAELDISNPTIPALRVAIERLAIIEKGFREWEIVEANRLKRLKWIREINQ